MESKHLVILGSGGYGRTILDLAEQLGYDPIITLDDKLPGLELNTYETYCNSTTVFIPAFGNNEFRLAWMKRLEESGATLATLIHPTAYVSPKATIHPGTVILPHAVINTDVVIERGCIM